MTQPFLRLAIEKDADGFVWVLRFAGVLVQGWAPSRGSAMEAACAQADRIERQGREDEFMADAEQLLRRAT